MNLTSLDAVFYAFAFLVPGFVLDSVLSTFQRRRPEPTQLSFLRLLTLSAINYAIWSWLVFLLVQSPWLRGAPLFSALLWFLVIFIGPVVVGLVLSYSSQREFVRQFLQWIGLRPIQVIPTAWDWQFGRMDEPHWMLVTLRDGSQVAGYFGSRSYASSDPGERDLFVEQLWEIPEDGSTWQPLRPGQGILISRNEIRHVEIWPVSSE